MKPNKKGQFVAAVADVLAGAVAPDAVADQILADAANEPTEAANEPTEAANEPSVTVVEPGLAQGLTAHEREQATHAMNGGKTPGVNPLSQLIRDAADGKKPKPKTEKAEKAERSKFSGKFFQAMKAGNTRREGTWGWQSMNKFFNAPDFCLSYEDFKAAGGRNNDLQWDIDHGNLEVLDARPEAPVVGDGVAASE